MNVKEAQRFVEDQCPSAAVSYYILEPVVDEVIELRKQVELLKEVVANLPLQTGRQG